VKPFFLSIIPVTNLHRSKRGLAHGRLIPMGSQPELIVQSTSAVLETALTSGMPDFEDAVQVACVISHGLDAIVTCDRDFVSTSIPVLSIAQLFQNMKSTE